MDWVYIGRRKIIRKPIESPHTGGSTGFRIILLRPISNAFMPKTQNCCYTQNSVTTKNPCCYTQNWCNNNPRSGLKFLRGFSLKLMLARKRFTFWGTAQRLQIARTLAPDRTNTRTFVCWISVDNSTRKSRCVPWSGFGVLTENKVGLSIFGIDSEQFSVMNSNETGPRT